MPVSFLWSDARRSKLIKGNPLMRTLDSLGAKKPDDPFAPPDAEGVEFSDEEQAALRAVEGGLLDDLRKVYLTCGTGDDDEGAIIGEIEERLAAVVGEAVDLSSLSNLRRRDHGAFADAVFSRFVFPGGEQ